MTPGSGSASSILARIEASGIVAIIRGSYSRDRLLSICETLQAARIDAIEITLNSSNALGHIEMLRGTLPGSVMIGAGTVRTAVLVERAHDAGAQFVISPNLDPEAVATADALGLLSIPGVLTPTEVHAAVELGCAAVKLFPATTFGVEYLKNLRAVFNEAHFIPTGGVSAGNIGSYRLAGAIAAGVGNALVSPHRGDDESLHQRAFALRAAWDEADPPAPNPTTP